MTDSQHGPNVVAPPPALFAGPLLLGAIVSRVLPVPRLRGPVRASGIPLVAAGAALIAWFAATMRRSRTPIDPRRAPKVVVEDGPFAYSRNPCYLGFALIYTGVSVLTGSLVALAALPAVVVGVNRGVIEREEAYLDEHFGAPYRAYRSRVRRWL